MRVLFVRQMHRWSSLQAHTRPYDEAQADAVENISRWCYEEPVFAGTGFIGESLSGTVEILADDQPKCSG